MPLYDIGTLCHRHYGSSDVLYSKLLCTSEYLYKSYNDSKGADIVFYMHIFQIIGSTFTCSKPLYKFESNRRMLRIHNIRRSLSHCKSGEYRYHLVYR
jgi:hypothetical protein